MASHQRPSATASGITRMPCGDKLERNGDALVIHAALPIDDLEPAPYRPPILLVGDERFVLVALEGTRKHPRYRLQLAPAGDANIYEVEGKVIGYDGQRHLERRRETARHALAWVLWVPTVPLMPFLGLLPEAWKQKLVHVGVDPGRASRLSLILEWILLTLLTVSYFAVGGFFTLTGAIIGALDLFVACDIAYRVTADADNKNPGAFALAGAVITWIRELVRGARGERDLLSEEERAQLTAPRERVDANTKLTDDRDP